VNEIYGADPNDPMFLQHCTDLVNCAVQHHCAYGDLYASACYCGSTDAAGSQWVLATSDPNGPMVPQCVINGPSSDAACVPEWQAAAESTDPAVIATRVYGEGSFKYPSGWANFLLECDLTKCPAECTH
jgi:hypothetical protein